MFSRVPVLKSPLATGAAGKCCSLTGSLVLAEGIINYSLLLPVILPCCKPDLNCLFEISLSAHNFSF